MQLSVRTGGAPPAAGPPRRFTLLETWASLALSCQILWCCALAYAVCGLVLSGLLWSAVSGGREGGKEWRAGGARWPWRPASAHETDSNGSMRRRD